MRTGDRILVTVKTYPELSKTYGISRKIYLAPKTVAYYRSSLRRKLRTQNRADLMRVVVESGQPTQTLAVAGIGRKEQ